MRRWVSTLAIQRKSDGRRHDQDRVSEIIQEESLVTGRLKCSMSSAVELYNALLLHINTTFQSTYVIDQLRVGLK